MTWYVVTVLLLWSAPLPPAYTEEAELFTPTRAAGSGGTHTAEAEGIYTLLSNPAAMSAVTEALFFTLSAGIGNVYQDGSLEFAAPPACYTSKGPLTFGVISKGVGFGLFNNTVFDGDNFTANIIAGAGMSFTVINSEAHKLDIGFSPNLLFRYAQANTAFLSAASVTAGILYSLHDVFLAGINCNDALSAGFLSDETGTGFTQVNRTLHGGIAVRLVSNAFAGITLLADYHDVLGSFFTGETDNPLRHLGGGLRLEIRNDCWLSLGVSGLQPAAGFGINLGAVKVDTALFSGGVEVGVKVVRD